MVVDADGNWLAVGLSGSLLVKRHGEDWEPASIGVSDDFYTVAVIERGRFLVGGKGNLYVVTL